MLTSIPNGNSAKNPAASFSGEACPSFLGRFFAGDVTVRVRSVESPVGLERRWNFATFGSRPVAGAWFAVDARWNSVTIPPSFRPFTAEGDAA